MSTKPLFLLRKAKKSSGEPDVVLWASNDFESTCATLDYLIVKSGKKLSSYFKAVATNFPVVNDLPAEGEIDFTWSERYQLSKDSMTWELKPGAAPDNAHYQGNTNVNGEDMTEIEENMLLPISGQELPIRWLAQHGSEKPVTHVSRDGLQALHIARAEELPAVTALAVSHKTSLLDPLEIRELHKLVRDTDKVFPNPDPEIVDIACGRSSAPMPQRVTEEGKQDDEEKPQPSGTTAVEQGEAETMEPDATEHHQDTQPLDAQSQVNSVDAKYQELRAELHEARKNIPSKNPVDADKLLAASRGEFVDGISDPNDPKWVKGIQTRDCVYQNQPETEKTSPDMNQPEPVVQQEPEIACNACGQTGGDNCPDCGAVMGDATYQETFDEESQVEAKENDPEEMEGAEHPHNENAGSDPHRDCSDETGEVADPVIVEDIEPGIYYGISNENYHAGPGISKSQLDDIADTPALYLWRKNAPVDTTKTKTLDLGTAFHCRVLEPEEFSNRFIVAPEFNRRTNAGKEEEKAFLMECASTGKTVITAEEGRKIELMYQSVMALPLGQWLVESAGHAESSIYWEDPETGILCRCRPDKIIPEFHWIMDVKTTADIQRFKTAYYDYRYHVQDAFYSDGYEAQFGVQPTFVFLVASTTIECGRYPVEIFMMGEEAKLAGQQEYHRNLRTLSDCLNTDEWPAIKTLSLPRWAKEYAND
ncbi:TPA: PD-(D/E)XK nuclease-like domain-containing protein [Escherichia coli]|nr:exodeoxyribonuclease 8 [Escherichia coli]EGN4503042.1 exodeoxyribonuclease 8 [Escherichia coli]HBA3695737.1 exodeoxyribonuclease 8 [Escherichia coli]HBA4533400.1 exodeoxyribonuclease 8 [Escherichia coli]HBA4542777.1 exodeoxyribonuclease 8 [Escherichia coli]